MSLSETARALLATNTQVKMSESRPKYLPWVGL